MNENTQNVINFYQNCNSSGPCFDVNDKRQMNDISVFSTSYASIFTWPICFKPSAPCSPVHDGVSVSSSQRYDNHILLIKGIFILKEKKYLRSSYY